MNTTKSPPPLGKGQLRCFQCRQAFPLKEGAWHLHDYQQVFLCKACAKASKEAPQSPSSSK